MDAGICAHRTEKQLKEKEDLGETPENERNLGQVAERP